ncbi:MAG: sigma-54-dependent Fis family transcriptional regulator [Geobacter sp.]|nr:sigma-54-dependent Fis family transcriptional regulator [Geobacter sp.]
MNKDSQILVVDDTQSFRFMVKGYLDDAGYRTTCVADGAEALAALEQQQFDLVLSDMVMPGMDGVELLRRIRVSYPAIPFVLITGNGSIDSAVAAMKEGANDYLLKPLNWEELKLVVQRLLEQARINLNYNRMLDLERQQYSFENITSCSQAMGQALDAAQKVAQSPQTTVCIFGESGVGKEVLARSIHSASGQTMGSFVAVNCAAIPETLLESELFGHVKGAFTGADTDREGKCSRARGGTLFLDEIGDMPLALQPKLLRLLEERVYEKVGSDRLETASFRVIAATHRNLADYCQQGRFRSDLYHRLNIFPITIPPLRERKEDIQQLAGQFIQNLRNSQGKHLPGISQAAMQQMQQYQWPGNVRELRNAIEYATIVSEETLIRPEHLRLPQIGADSCCTEPVDGRISVCFSFSRDEFSLETLTSRSISWALEQCDNNKSAAARLLKVSRKLFY